MENTYILIHLIEMKKYKLLTYKKLTKMEIKTIEKNNPLVDIEHWPGFMECCKEINALEQPESDEAYMRAKSIESDFILKLLKKVFLVHEILGFKNLDSVTVDVWNADDSEYKLDRIGEVRLKLDVNSTFEILDKNGNMIPFSVIRQVGIVSNAVIESMVAMYRFIDSVVCYENKIIRLC